MLDCTEDSALLQDVLQKLVQHKEDTQQRSWQLHEDEHIILELVEKLRDLLVSGNYLLHVLPIPKASRTYIMAEM